MTGAPWKALGIVACALLVACSPGNKSENDGERSRSEKISKGIPVPEGPPPADVVRKLEFSRYEAIKEAGGLRLTLTATGKSKVVHPKLYQVEVKECRPQPQAHPGDYECSLHIQLSLDDDGGDPSWQGERISISWDSIEGAWKTP